MADEADSEADDFEAQEGDGAKVDEADEADECKRGKVDIDMLVEEAEESQLL